jgi:hypothetical protein
MKPPELPDMTQEEVMKAMANVLAAWPLYRVFMYRDPDQIVRFPSIISQHCPRCKRDQYWQLKTRDAYYVGHCSATFTCRNCGCEESLFHFYWVKPKDEPAVFFKTGQYPPLEERIEPELEKQLSVGDGPDLDFYRKAIRCRNFAYGLAALSYLRRVVENRMNDLLDLIAELARTSGFAPEEIAALATAKQSRTFDQKVAYAATILPPVLRPGGQNPVDLLHDLASEGIHGRDEDECLQVFDESRSVFEYLFRELRVRKADADSFLDGVRDLAARRARRRKAPQDGRSDA